MYREVLQQPPQAQALQLQLQQPTRVYWPAGSELPGPTAAAAAGGLAAVPTPASASAPLAGADVLSPYPPLEPLQQKRLAARRHAVTYCYDFPAVFEGALRDIWAARLAAGVWRRGVRGRSNPGPALLYGGPWGRVAIRQGACARIPQLPLQPNGSTAPWLPPSTPPPPPTHPQPRPPLSPVHRNHSDCVCRRAVLHPPDRPPGGGAGDGAAGRARPRGRPRALHRLPLAAQAGARAAARGHQRLRHGGVAAHTAHARVPAGACAWDLGPGTGPVRAGGPCVPHAGPPGCTLCCAFAFVVFCTCLANLGCQNLLCVPAVEKHVTSAGSQRGGRRQRHHVAERRLQPCRRRSLQVGRSSGSSRALAPAREAPKPPWGRGFRAGRGERTACRVLWFRLCAGRLLPVAPAPCTSSTPWTLPLALTRGRLRPGPLCLPAALSSLALALALTLVLPPGLLRSCPWRQSCRCCTWRPMPGRASAWPQR